MKTLIGLLMLGVSFGGWVESAIAQVSPDSTLPTRVTRSNNLNFTIEGGARSGGNLFHSFSEFSVPTGGSVVFNTVPGIQNILSRVTGGSISTIDGLLGVNGQANLFLLNPNGILFGNNARFAIGGSFIGTTAKSIRFTDGLEFSAVNLTRPPLLTISTPIGLQPGTISDNSLAATITNRANLSTGQDLVLSADRLDLEGQLQAGRDLTLQAQTTVRLRDSVAAPLIAKAGRNLTIQGNQSIDLLALSHPQTQIMSGKTLRLISDGEISGDAHFVSGGSLMFQTLRGSPGKVVSKFDPIIFANGDVEFGDYTGVALKVEATGSITAGNIRITGPDTAVPVTDPDFAVLTTQPAVILRAGVPTVPAPNVPQLGVGDVPTDFNAGFPSAESSFGSITVGNIDTSDSTGGNGGSITLAAAGDIAVNGSLFATADSFDNSGKGGAVSLLSKNGNLFVGGMLSTSSYSAVGNSGDAGTIALTADNGSIELGSTVRAESSTIYGDSANGGAISLTAGKDIAIADRVQASSYTTGSGSSGNGGAISLKLNGNLSAQSSLETLSFAQDQGSSGNGGTLSIAAANGSVSIGGAYTGSTAFGGNSGNGGTISIATTNGDLSVLSGLSSYSNSATGNSGDAGPVSLTVTNGNLSINRGINALSYSDEGNSGRGGAIAVSTTRGDISTQGSFYSASISRRGASGNGGTIALQASQGNIIGNGATELNTFSIAPQGNAGNGGAVSLAAQNQVSGVSILTASSSAQSGAVTLSGAADFTLADSVILTSKQVSLEFASVDPIIVPVDGVGQSGDVVLTSAGNLSLSNSRIASDAKGNGAAGNVTLTSPGQMQFNNSQITSSTSNRGQAGTIALTAGQNITLADNSKLSAFTSNSGKAGDIVINSPTITVTGGAELSAATEGRGQGGTILLNAPTAVNLLRSQDTSPVLSVEASNAGKAGGIVINTPTLTVADKARITATATATATHSEGGGSITLNASQVLLSGIVGVFAETQGQAPAGTLRLKPYSNQAALDVLLTPQSQISASTMGSGKGGDLILSAPGSITLHGAGKLAVETTGSGDAGNIILTTQQLNLKDGVTLSASSSGQGKAGSLTIAADQVAINQGAQVLSNTSGNGNAGDIQFFVKDQLRLTGAGIFATTTAESTGAGGNIKITAPMIDLQAGARITVGSLGSGTGGNITLSGDSLSLRNGSAIDATTASGNGGNLDLNFRDRVQMRNQSLLSAEARNAGNGGNIDLRARFIFGSGNSDIVANAFEGRGGNIQVTTDGIFGLAFRDRLTAENDITTSSQFGVNGSVQINLLSFNPTNGLTAMPVDLVDPSSQIVSLCSASDRGNSFTITGRGGIPENPAQQISLYRTWRDLRVPTKLSDQAASPSAPTPPLIEATTWRRTANGKVELIAASSAVNPVNPLCAEHWVR